MYQFFAAAGCVAAVAFIAWLVNVVEVSEDQRAELIEERQKNADSDIEKNTRILTDAELDALINRELSSSGYKSKS